MSEIKNYTKDFVERTLKLLEELQKESKKHDLEVTLLLNCLLGLIVSTSEHLNKSNNKISFSIKLNDDSIKEFIPIKIKAVKKPLEEFKKEYNKSEFLKNLHDKGFHVKQTEIKYMTKKELLNNELLWLLNKIRNGVAHQNIMPINDSGSWEGVRIWNINSSGLKDFAVEFSARDLKSFSIMVAKKHLDSFNQ